MIHILPLAAFEDNYIWLLHDGHQAWAIDPGSAAPVQAALQDLGLSLASIWLTHHHADHIGGVAELLAQHPAAQVVGAAHPSIAQLSPSVHAVYGGESLHALGQRWQVLPAPGHTLSHVLFYCPDLPLAHGPQPVLFVGDTLFSLGCGRLFEGSSAQMLASLQRIATLPPHCLLYPAHEYTATNLRFAQQLQPQRTDLQHFAQQVQSLRQQGQPTLPCRLSQERQLNPFLQSLDPDFCQTMALHLSALAPNAPAPEPTPLGIFSALRELRNTFA